MINADRNIDIMGIINLTDDSYYAPSRSLDSTGRPDISRILCRVEDMVSEGAGIIDFGACSSRPGSVQIGWKEEWKRLEPVMEAFLEKGAEVRFSIDTWHSEVISRVYDLSVQACGVDGAKKRLIVNDISAGEDDPQMLPLVGETGLRYIAMHKRGAPADMQERCIYGDVVADVREYFEAFAEKAAFHGVKDWILDPGFGFAKTMEQNHVLLGRLDELAGCGQTSVLVGVSRKSMIYKYLGITPEEALPATQVVHMKALQKGADVLRVHDVREAVRTVSLYRVLR